MASSTCHGPRSGVAVQGRYDLRTHELALVDELGATVQLVSVFSGGRLAPALWGGITHRPVPVSMQLVLRSLGYVAWAHSASEDEQVVEMTLLPVEARGAPVGPVAPPVAVEGERVDPRGWLAVAVQRLDGLFDVKLVEERHCKEGDRWSGVLPRLDVHPLFDVHAHRAVAAGEIEAVLRERLGVKRCRGPVRDWRVLEEGPAEEVVELTHPGGIERSRAVTLVRQVLTWPVELGGRQVRPRPVRLVAHWYDGQRYDGQPVLSIRDSVAAAYDGRYTASAHGDSPGVVAAMSRPVGADVDAWVEKVYDAHRRRKAEQGLRARPCELVAWSVRRDVDGRLLVVEGMFERS